MGLSNELVPEGIGAGTLKLNDVGSDGDGDSGARPAAVSLNGAFM